MRKIILDVDEHGTIQDSQGVYIGCIILDDRVVYLDEQGNSGLFLEDMKHFISIDALIKLKQSGYL